MEEQLRQENIALKENNERFKVGFKSKNNK